MTYGALTVFRESSHPLVLFRIQDAVTGGTGHLRQVVVGVTGGRPGALELLRDEQVLELLNRRKPGYADEDRSVLPGSVNSVPAWLEQARVYAIRNVDGLRLPFRKPLLDDLALFWPEGDRHP